MVFPESQALPAAPLPQSDRAGSSGSRDSVPKSSGVDVLPCPQTHVPAAICSPLRWFLILSGQKCDVASRGSGCSWSMALQGQLAGWLGGLTAHWAPRWARRVCPGPHRHRAGAQTLHEKLRHEEGDKLQGPRQKYYYNSVVLFSLWVWQLAFKFSPVVTGAALQKPENREKVKWTWPRTMGLHSSKLQTPPELYSSFENGSEQNPRSLHFLRKYFLKFISM